MRTNSIALIALLAGICLCGAAHAQKKGGGKGGGKEDPEPAGPLMVELSTTEGLVVDISELKTSGKVEAVGWIDRSAQSAMYWKVDGDGTVQDSIVLSTAAPPDHEAAYSLAAGINNNSVIVGYGYEEIGEPAEWPCWPLLWSTFSARAFLLPIPEGFSHGQAWHVNDDGIVIGYVWNDTARWVNAWKIDVSGVTPVVKDQITFLDGSHYYYFPSDVARVAQSGIGVATVESLAGQTLDAYRFQLLWNGSELQVEAIEAPFDDLAWSIALDVNDTGWVSGDFKIADGFNDEAFVVDDTGALVTLETLPPARHRGQTIEYTNVFATAVNNYGVSVGRVVPERLVVSEEAAMWDANGTLTLLPEYWDYSLDINDVGWIGGGSTLDTPAVLIPQQ